MTHPAIGNSRFVRIALVVLLMLWLAPPLQAADAIEEELKAAFDKDQNTRGSTGPTDLEGDERRRFRVLELLAQGLIATPASRYYAAMILQHTPQDLSNGRFVSRSAENYLLAHYLAKSAAEAGQKGARNLAAACYDRYLVARGRPQKYGTQFSLNPKTGRMEFDPVDPATTDAERAAWDVTPIDETLQRFRKSGLDRPRPIPVPPTPETMVIAPP